MSAPTDYVRLQCGLENDALSRLVLICISFFVNYRTGQCYPSIPTLCKETNLAENTVRKRIRELEKLGFIQVQEREGLTSLITLVGYKDWLDKASTRKPVTPSHSEGDTPSRGEPHPFTARAEPLHAVSLTPSRGEPEIYNINILNNSFSKNEIDSDTTLGSEETKVWFEKDQLKLSDSFNQFWLKQFDNLQDDLTLALMQIAGYIQPNSFQSLEKQTSAQLSKIVRERKERDRRYKAAAQNKSVNGKPVSQPSKNDELLDKIYNDHWAKIERGEIKL